MPTVMFSINTVTPSEKPKDTKKTKRSRSKNPSPKTLASSKVRRSTKPEMSWTTTENSSEKLLRAKYRN
jgi:hypothetical protein